MTKISKHDKWGIIHLFDVSLTNLKLEILQFHNEWLTDTSRQTVFTTHEHTFMYKLINFDYDWYPKKSCSTKIINRLSAESMIELKNIYDALEKYCDGRVVHSEIINMKPNSRIRIHKDRGDLLYVARRFHIPIKTNPETFFIVDDEKYFLDEGSLYELNNIQYHGVVNNSEEYRIHLIIDVLPSEFCDNVRFESD